MVQDLFDSKNKVDNCNKLVLIHRSFDYIAKRAEKMPPSTNKNEFIKILNIVNEILKFNEQIKWGQELKILTPTQMLSRLPIPLAQLNAGNNSEKLKMKSDNYYIFCTDQKSLTKNIYKSLIDIKNMETIFMNSENSKTSEQHRFRLDLTDKLNLKHPQKNIALANLSIYYTCKNKSKYNNNRFKISAPTWNDTFDLPDGSYSFADIQDYFELIIKKHETLTENPPVQIYVNKIKNRIVFKIKTGYKLELLTPETMKLLGSTKKICDKGKDGENVLKFRIF